MDKSYLIHNIKIADNPLTQHQTMDIEFKNLDFAEGDVTSDVTLYGKTNGVIEDVISAENVSLTGAGGGGGDLAINYVDVVIYPYAEGDPLNRTIERIYAECYLFSDIISEYGSDNNDNAVFLVAAYSENTIKIPVPVNGETHLVLASLTDSNTALWMWQGSEPIEVTGDAEYKGDGLLNITGSCTLKLEFWED